MLWFIAGYIYGHIAEWLIHRYILHGVGLKRSSIFSFHFLDHHSSVRKNDFYDIAYSNILPKWNAAGKEIFYLFLILVFHLPIYLYIPYFYFALIFSAVEYYYKHRRAHMNLGWAEENIPWHYDHHMGDDQHYNWGVRSDLIDKVMKTRRYIGDI